MARPPRPEVEIPELTPEQESTKAEIKRLSAEIKSLQEKKRAISKNCQHVNVPGGKYEWVSWSKSWELCCGVYCLVCGEDTGYWYCPESPDHVCKYDDDDQCHDFCLHCHQPEERK